jgi:hypothetical protein
MQWMQVQAFRGPFRPTLIILCGQKTKLKITIDLQLAELVLQAHRDSGHYL